MLILLPSDLVKRVALLVVAGSSCGGAGSVLRLPSGVVSAVDASGLDCDSLSLLADVRARAQVCSLATGLFSSKLGRSMRVQR